MYPYSTGATPQPALRLATQEQEVQLAKLEDAMIGRQKVATADGSQFGWIAGDHILDTRFDLAKNIINDSLQFALRVDEIKIPSDLLRAYYFVELEALASQNPSGHASAKQKREARQVAKERLEREASDGRTRARTARARAPRRNRIINVTRRQPARMLPR